MPQKRSQSCRAPPSAKHLAYEERVEREDAERAQALIDLSRLRKIPLATLMTDLGFVLNA